MIRRNIPRIIIFVLGALIVLGAANAVAASNTVSGGRLDEQNTALTINSKKPAACTMNLAAIIVCTGGVTCDGTNANELLLGTSGNDTIRGRGGRDCILGGDGNDDIQGNNGGDICIGGPGADTFNKCETAIDP